MRNQTVARGECAINQERVCNISIDILFNMVANQPHMATEQMKYGQKAEKLFFLNKFLFKQPHVASGYHIRQFRAHLCTNKDDPVEREKFMIQPRDESLRSQEKESRAQVEESTRDMTRVKQSMKLQQPVETSKI